MLNRGIIICKTYKKIWGEAERCQSVFPSTIAEV